MTTSGERFRMGALAVPVYLPSLVYSIGGGALLPVLPALAMQRGASLALAGLIAGLYMIGELVGDLPAGALVARLGEKRGMLLSAAVGVVGTVVALLSDTVWALAIGVFLIGLSAATFALARHAFMTSFVPIAHRARALSTLGGVFRAGMAVGPLLAGAVIHVWSLPAVLWLVVGGFALTALVVALTPDPGEVLAARRAEVADAGRGADEDPPVVRHGLGHALRSNAGLLARMGPVAFLIATLRASRLLILPLWASALGLPDTATAWIIGVAGAVDFALFYAGGWIMDRFGRGWTAIPSMIALGAGHLALPLVLVAADPAVGFAVLAGLLAIANGIGAGVLMTLGSDLAPPEHPTPFLSAWRFIADAGSAGAPLVISALTAIASLTLASTVVGALGVLGAGLVARYLPRYVPSRRTVTPGGSR